MLHIGYGVAPGEGDSPRVRMRGESPSPRPSPREKRREGEPAPPAAWRASHGIFAIDFKLSAFSLLAGRDLLIQSIEKTTGAGFLRGLGAVNISDLTR